MPIEYQLLRNQPPPFHLGRCRFCEWGHVQPFMRGQVQSTWRRLLRLPYCCVICDNCKSIIGYEKPKRHCR